MMDNEDEEVAVAPVEIDWVWRSSRGFFVSVDGYGFGPMTADQLIRFPRWLFRHLFEVKDHELQVALIVSRRLNELKRGEWKRLLASCERWYGKGNSR